MPDSALLDEARHYVASQSLWWTSTWPLMVLAALLAGFVDFKTNMGAVISWGLTLAWLFARKPVFTFREAVANALKVTVPVQLVLGLIGYWLIISRLNPDLGVVPFLAAVVIVSILMTVVWAFFIVRKARHLAEEARRNAAASPAKPAEFEPPLA